MCRMCGTAFPDTHPTLGPSRGDTTRADRPPPMPGSILDTQHSARDRNVNQAAADTPSSVVFIRPGRGIVPVESSAR